MNAEQLLESYRPDFVNAVQAALQMWRDLAENDPDWLEEGPSFLIASQLCDVITRVPVRGVFDGAGTASEGVAVHLQMVTESGPWRGLIFISPAVVAELLHRPAHADDVVFMGQ